MFERESLLDKAAGIVKKKVDVQTTNDDVVTQLVKMNDKMELLIDTVDSTNLYTDVISDWIDFAVSAGVISAEVLSPRLDYFLRLHSISLSATNAALAAAFTLDIKAVESVGKLGTIRNIFENITLSNYNPTWHIEFTKPLDLPVNFKIRIDNNGALMGNFQARLFIQYDMVKKVKKERLPHS